MSSKKSTNEYEFTLVLADLIELTEAAEDALYEAGCSDATIALRGGRIFITFSREDESLKDAILSAIADIRKANIGTDVLRVDDRNLVTQAEIGRKIGRSRQLVNQYILGIRGPGGFPAPACEIGDGQLLWFWREVARWLWEHDMVKEDVVRDAEEVDVINNVLEFQRQKKRNGALAREVVAFVTKK